MYHLLLSYPLFGFSESINIIEKAKQLFVISAGNDGTMRRIRTYAIETMYNFFNDITYYIRWLRVAPLTADEETQAFNLMMTFLSMGVGYENRSRAKCQAITFLLEKQLQWTSQQMEKLNDYLSNAIEVQTGDSEWLQQIIGGNFSSRLKQLQINEASRRLLQQLKQHQPMFIFLSNFDATPIIINESFYSPATENLLNRMAEFIFTYQLVSSSSEGQKTLFRLRSLFFSESWFFSGYTIYKLILFLMDSIYELDVSGQVEPTEDIRALWKLVVDLFDYLLTNKAIDPNNIIYNIDDSFRGNSALQFLLLDTRFITTGLSSDLQETVFYSISRIVKLFVTAGYKLDYKNDEGETAYDVIKDDKEMTDFLLPALRKSVGRLESLAANAVPAYFIPYLGQEINFPTVLSKNIKRNLCF